MEKPELAEPQSSGEDIENKTCPPEEVSKVYYKFLDPLSEFLMHRTTRYCLALHWSGETRVRSDMRREAIWGIVVLVDKDELQVARKAVEEWSNENGDPIPIRVGQGQFIGGVNMRSR